MPVENDQISRVGGVSLTGLAGFLRKLDATRADMETQDYGLVQTTAQRSLTKFLSNGSLSSALVNRDFLIGLAIAL